MYLKPVSPRHVKNISTKRVHKQQDTGGAMLGERGVVLLKRLLLIIEHKEQRINITSLHKQRIHNRRMRNLRIPTRRLKRRLRNILLLTLACKRIRRAIPRGIEHFARCAYGGGRDGGGFGAGTRDLEGVQEVAEAGGEEGDVCVG